MFGAILTEAILTDANLTIVSLGDTHFANCVTLHQAKGLSAVRHVDASSLDARTLRACVNDLPDVFMQGVGYNQEEIETLKRMYAGGGIRYYSCFLSYAHANSDFADHFHADLVAGGVNCWKDTDDMKGGDFWRRQINEAIKKHDKLIVVCSAESLGRKEVVEEIIEAIEYERQAGEQKLFPVRLDGFLFTVEAERLAYDTLPARQRREDWLTYLRDYHIPDFSRWKVHSVYKKTLGKLLHDLKNPQKRAV